MRSRVLAEHRCLDELFREARKAFRMNAGSESVQAAFRALREALETHFDQEDRLYYPAIWALRPDLKAELQAFVAAHEKFRSQLGRIQAALIGGDVAGGNGGLEALTHDFGRHEASEESLLVGLDRDLEEAG